MRHSKGGVGRRSARTGTGLTHRLVNKPRNKTEVQYNLLQPLCLIRSTFLRNNVFTDSR